MMIPSKNAGSFGPEFIFLPRFHCANPAELIRRWLMDLHVDDPKEVVKWMQQVSRVRESLTHGDVWPLLGFGQLRFMVVQLPHVPTARCEGFPRR
jgi:hypothetical protein